MRDSPTVIDTEEAFHAELTALFDAAKRGNLDVRGGYGVRTASDQLFYEVLVTSVVRPPTEAGDSRRASVSASNRDVASK